MHTYSYVVWVWLVSGGFKFSAFGDILPHSRTAARVWPCGHCRWPLHHWMLLLSSVPFASDMFILPMEWPTWLTPSLRGGMRSLMRSRPLASSKLLILCCGEKPRMAVERHRSQWTPAHQMINGTILLKLHSVKSVICKEYITIGHAVIVK